MGKAFQCDLCKTLQEGDPPQELTVKPTATSIATPYALCDACAQSFADWRTDRVPYEEADRA